MQLSDTLRVVGAAMMVLQDGSHAMTPDGWAALRETLRRAVRQAEGLEHATRMLEARQPLPTSAVAFVDGLNAGRVAILPTRLTLIAHGFDDRPDRRFGDDEFGGIAP